MLFTNVNVFDGTSETLQNGVNVLVEDNFISQISPSAISANGATVINGLLLPLPPVLEAQLKKGIEQ